MVCNNCGKESKGNTQFCSGCGTALDVQQGQQFPQQGQQFPQQGQQFPQQGQQFQQQGQQFPQQGQQFPQQGQQFPQQGMQGPPPSAPLKKGLSKKLMIIIGAAAVVVIGVVLVLLFVFSGNSYESEEFFDVGGDMVPSVMYVLGEKREISEVTVYSSKSADKIVVEYSVSDNQGDEMEEYAGVLVDDFDFIALDEYDFSGKRGSDFQFVKVSDEDDDHIVIVTIDFNNSGYTLTIERREGELNVGDDDDDGDNITMGGDDDDNNNNNDDADNDDIGDNGDADNEDTDNGDADNEDESTLEYTEGWPTDELPSGFPVYPDGQPRHAFENADVFIIIGNTGKKTFEGYVADLEAWGFEFGEPISDGIYMGSTENMRLYINYNDKFNETFIGLMPDG